MVKSAAIASRGGDGLIERSRVVEPSTPPVPEYVQTAFSWGLATRGTKTTSRRENKVSPCEQRFGRHVVLVATLDPSVFRCRNCGEFSCQSKADAGGSSGTSTKAARRMDRAQVRL